MLDLSPARCSDLGSPLKTEFIVAEISCTSPLSSLLLLLLLLNDGSMGGSDKGGRRMLTICLVFAPTPSCFMEEFSRIERSFVEPALRSLSSPRPWSWRKEPTNSTLFFAVMLKEGNGHIFLH